LQPDNVLPAVGLVLILVQDVEGHLEHELERDVEEDVRLHEALKDGLETEVLLVWLEELVVFVYHDHAHRDVA